MAKMVLSYIWTDIEHPPDENGLYLVSYIHGYSRNKSQCYGFADYYDGAWYIHHTDGSLNTITHWQILPKLPELPRKD